MAKQRKYGIFVRPKFHFCVKGQTHGAGAAGGLIGLITLFLVLYIVFLPPEIREELLADDEIEEVDEELRRLNNTLLEKHVGRLEFFPPTFDHFVPSVYIFEKKDSTILDTFNPFYVANGWFGRKTYETQFLVEDLENTENVVLAFSALKHKGILKVTLNDKEVFSFDIATSTPPPIELKKPYLKKVNTIKVEVSGVGLKFWDKNQYSFEDVKIIGDITDISRQRAQNIFTLSGTEAANLLNAGLFFVPSCNPEEVGILSIIINGRTAYSAVPDCLTTNFLEMDASFLKEGSNTIVFQTSAGSYLLENIKVQTFLKEVRSFVEYFEVIPELFDAVINNERDVFLEIDFIDDGLRKRAQLNVNGHLTFIDQIEPFYTRNIDPWVVPGTRNYIEIVPETALNIPEVRVVVE